MLEKSERNSKSQAPRVQENVFKCLVLSIQVSKPQIYLVYNHTRQRKVAHSRIGEARTRERLTFLLEK